MAQASVRAYFKSSTGKVFVLCSLLLCSCRPDFYPFEPGPPSFSVYGYLDTAADTQFIRIIPMRRQLERDGSGFEGTVTITKLETGETYTARDSMATLSDGSTGLVYWADFKPQPSQRYRLDVVRDDGLAVTALTLVPETIPGDSIYIFPVRFDGRLFYPIYLLSHTQPPFDLRFVYEVSEVDRGPRDRFEVRYPGDLTGRQNDRPKAWYLEADVIRDAKDVREAWSQRHGRPPDRLYLHGITISAATVSDGWIPPGGVFDPEVLVKPGVHGNIEGGDGFFGAVARYQLSWTLADETYLGFAGYTYLGPTWPYTLPIF